MNKNTLSTKNNASEVETIYTDETTVSIPLSSSLDVEIIVRRISDKQLDGTVKITKLRNGSIKVGGL
jgi:uncharacterized membrane protein YjjP (DUF1212 family)